MVFNLPGNNPLTALRRVFTRCLAYSRTFNTRNLEYYWYPCWNHTLFDLIGKNPRLLVAPQFPLYISPWVDVDDPQEKDEDVDEKVETSDNEGEEDTSDDEEVGDTWLDGTAEVVSRNPATPTSTSPRRSATPTSASPRRSASLNSGSPGHPTFASNIDDDSEDLLADVSFASTEPEYKPLARVTDFAILHVAPQQNAALPTRYEGYRVDQLTVPLLMEEKRFPSRSLAGVEFDEELKVKIREAQQALIFQVALLFRKFHSMDEVMVIGASGPWWCNTVFRRSPNVHISDDEFSEAMRENNHDALYGTVIHRRWSMPLRLDTPTSTKRFKAIHDRLVALQ